MVNVIFDSALRDRSKRPITEEKIKKLVKDVGLFYPLHGVAQHLELPEIDDEERKKKSFEEWKTRFKIGQRSFLSKTMRPWTTFAKGLQELQLVQSYLIPVGFNFLCKLTDSRNL